MEIPLPIPVNYCTLSAIETLSGSGYTITPAYAATHQIKFKHPRYQTTFTWEPEFECVFFINDKGLRQKGGDYEPANVAEYLTEGTWIMVWSEAKVYRSDIRSWISGTNK